MIPYVEYPDPDETTHSAHRHTWLPPRREFEREIYPGKDGSTGLSSRSRCRMQQRSDGILYYLVWEVGGAIDPLYPDPAHRATIKFERAKYNEQRWDSMLDDVTTVKPAKLGILSNLNDPRLKISLNGWMEVKLVTLEELAEMLNGKQ